MIKKREVAWAEELLGGDEGRLTTGSSGSWRPCEISPRALSRLRAVSTRGGRKVVGEGTVAGYPVLVEREPSGELAACVAAASSAAVKRVNREVLDICEAIGARLGLTQVDVALVGTDGGVVLNMGAWRAAPLRR